MSLYGLPTQLMSPTVGATTASGTATPAGVRAGARAPRPLPPINQMVAYGGGMPTGDPRLQGSTGVDPRYMQAGGAGGTAAAGVLSPQIAPLPGGMQTAAAPPPGNSGMNFQMNQTGAAGLNSMGIPLPPTYTPRDAMGNLINPNIYNQPAGAQTGGSSLPSWMSNPSAAQANVNRYTNGVLHTAMPVAPGSAHNAGIGGPNAQAVLGGQINQMRNDQMLQAFGGRGGMRTTDYAVDPATGQLRLYSAYEQMPTGGAAGNPSQAASGAAGTASGATGSLGATANGANPATDSTSSGNNAQYDMLNTLAKNADERQRAAEEANEQRYRDILSGYGARFDRNMNTLEGMGDAERAATNRQYNALQSRNLQDAVGRGLAGTNILPGMRTLTERERTQELGQLDERLRRERIGLDTSLSGDTLGFMERRDDVAPNMDDLIRLAEALGRSGDNNLAGAQPYGGYGGYPGGGYGMPMGMGGQQFNPQQLAQMQAGGRGIAPQQQANLFNMAGQGAGNAISQYGQSLASLIPQAAQAVSGYFQNPGQVLGNAGNTIGGGMIGGTAGVGNALAGGINSLAGMLGGIGNWLQPAQSSLNAGRTASSAATSAMGGGIGSIFPSLFN